MLENYKAMVKNMIEQRKAHNDKFNLLHNFLMPEYEKNCLAEYVGNMVEGKFIFADSSDVKFS